MKFLLLLRPWTGRYLELGTGSFLWLHSYENLFAMLRYKNTLWQRLIPHRSGVFLQELLRWRLPVALQVPEGLSLSELSMGLKANVELAADIGNLEMITNKIRLVWRWWSYQRWSRWEGWWVGIWTCRLYPWRGDCTPWGWCCRSITPFFYWLFLFFIMWNFIHH
jgi:hypothetical protein